MCQKDEQTKVCYHTQCHVYVMHIFGVLGVARMFGNQLECEVCTWWSVVGMLSCLPVRLLGLLGHMNGSCAKQVFTRFAGTHSYISLCVCCYRKLLLKDAIILLGSFYHLIHVISFP